MLGCAGFAKLEASSAQDRQFLLGLCIHTSDLSAQVLPWSTARQWEDRISQEFASQASEEIALGRTPAPFMQFNLQDRQQRGKLQVDFVDFVLVPLWDNYTQFLPELLPLWAQLMANREKYELQHRGLEMHDDDDDPFITQSPGR